MSEKTYAFSSSVTTIENSVFYICKSIGYIAVPDKLACSIAESAV